MADPISIQDSHSRLKVTFTWKIKNKKSGQLTKFRV